MIWAEHCMKINRLIFLKWDYICIVLWFDTCLCNLLLPLIQLSPKKSNIEHCFIRFIRMKRVILYWEHLKQTYSTSNHIWVIHLKKMNISTYQSTCCRWWQIQQQIISSEMVFILLSTMKRQKINDKKSAWIIILMS